MLATVVLIALNVADALLLRIIMQLGAIGLNPLVPPLQANLIARGLIAIAVVLVVYLTGKRILLWWLVFLTLGLIVYHGVEYLFYVHLPEISE